MNILKYMFPVPKEESKRVITFANKEDYISFRLDWIDRKSAWITVQLPMHWFTDRHHVYKKGEGKEIDLKEVGPRFEMKCELNLCVMVMVNVMWQ